jgi:hypothetical protein
MYIHGITLISAVDKVQDQKPWPRSRFHKGRVYLVKEKRVFSNEDDEEKSVDVGEKGNKFYEAEMNCNCWVHVHGWFTASLSHIPTYRLLTIIIM